MPRIPSLSSGASSPSAKLPPAEAYLLSLVDGNLDEDELALMSGQAPEQVARIFDKLAASGIVSFGAAQDRLSTPDTRPSRPSAPSAGPARATPSEPPGAELPPAKRARIDNLFTRLDELSYYEILGVTSGADKKQIKSAYYGLAPEFHPDKFFRRQIGGYRHKIEAIFGRITLAHDVLIVPEKRADYDAYLAQTQVNRSTAAVLDDVPREVEAILAAVEKAAAEAARATKPPSTSPQARPPSPEETLRQRREALARKLTGARGVRASPPNVVLAPPPPDPAIAARAAEAVRLHKERAMREVKRAEVLRYIEAGKAALEAKNWAGAANSYRVAASIDPEDPSTQATCSEALQVVAAALADGYWKQGLYEEGQERWGEAALSFSKVCTGRPKDAAAHDRVAQMTIKSSTNFRRAVEFSRQAIELDPKRPEYRITLSNAYAAAGMEQSAASELARVLELFPKDPRATALVAAARTAHNGLRAAAQARAAAQNGSAVPGSPVPEGPSSRPPSGEHALSVEAAGVPAPASKPAAAPPSALSPPPPPFSPAPAGSAGSAGAPRKESGIHAFVNAVRSVLAPKEGK